MPWSSPIAPSFLFKKRQRKTRKKLETAAMCIQCTVLTGSSPGRYHGFSLTGKMAHMPAHAIGAGRRIDRKTD